MRGCNVALEFNKNRPQLHATFQQSKIIQKGIPTSRAGLERKIGKAIINSINGKKK